MDPLPNSTPAPANGSRRWLVGARRLLAGGLLACLAPMPPAAVAASAAGADAAARPRVALVLSGGGARGFAHVGVLRVLQELRVPVDMVVGTSMGAVVGGAWAAGRSVEELEGFVRLTNWDAVVADRPQRQDLTFRRKEDDLAVPSHIDFGVHRGGFVGPSSAVDNGAVEDALAQLLPLQAHALAGNALPLPFRAVATDLLSGELVDLGDSPLLQALRASMSVPGVFAPTRLGSRLVVDGGLVRNLPVDMARALGAQVVIAVNVGTPLAGEEALGSALGVAQQMLNILTEQNVQRSLRELAPPDILIAPDLREVSFLDFRAHARAIAAGERAARDAAERLRALAVPTGEYAAREASRLAQRPDPDTPRPLARLTVTPTAHTDPRVLAAQSGLELGQPLRRRDAERAAQVLRGRDEFERVDVEVRDSVEGREVVLTPTEAAWARSRLRLGLELASDFRDDHRFTVSALHVGSWLNPWGAELRTLARLGSTRLLSTEWWQPLAPGSPWFASLAAGRESRSSDLFEAGTRVARVAVGAHRASLSLGRQFGNRAELRIGVERNVGQGEQLLPVSATPLQRFAETNRFATLRWDTLETLAFPTRGQIFAARWEEARSRRSGVPSLAHRSLQAMAALRLGEWGGHLYAEWARSASGFAPLSLGGFMRLSGAERDSINGGKVLLGRAVLARRIGQMPTGLGGAIHLGLSFEYGDAFPLEESVQLSSLRPAGSAFVAVDTRFGPVYLAVGAAKGAGSTAYLFIGPIW